MDCVKASTSSAAASTQPPAAESAPTGSNDGQETPSGVEDLTFPSRPREDKMEGDNEQVTEEVPKKSSGIRFRKKPKQPKQRRSSKGVRLCDCHVISCVSINLFLCTF